MVLDVSKFEHPGPQTLITDNIGKDITQLFDDQAHSKNALQMVRDMKIGYIQQNKLLQNQYYDEVSKEEKLIHERLDALIDVKKPLIPQVKKLTNKEFLAFVKRPRHIEDTDGIIIFEDEEEDRAHKRSYKKITSIVVPVLVSEFLIGFYLCETYLEFF